MARRTLDPTRITLTRSPPRRPRTWRKATVDKLFESRFIDRVRLFRRLRHRQEFRLQFF